MRLEKVKIGELTMTAEEAKTFLGIVKLMESEHRSERDIAKALGLRSVIDLRERKTLTYHILWNEMISEARRMKAEGMSIQQIAEHIEAALGDLQLLAEREELYPATITQYTVVAVD